MKTDLVIGDDNPDETLDITGDYYLDGNLTIISRGVVNIENADFRINGKIFIANQGQMHITSSNFTVIQEYIYQHDAIVAEQGEFTFTDVQFHSSGHSWSIGLAGQAQYRCEDSEISDGFITVGLLEDSQAHISDTKTPGEFLCFGRNTLNFEKSDFLLYWIVLFDTSRVLASLPVDSLVTNWTFSSDEPDVEGIPYTVSIDSCTQVMWGLISRSDSDGEFSNTQFRTAGLMFNKPDSIVAGNITNESKHVDDVISIPDRNLRLINSEVRTWNFYPSDQAIVTINNSVTGEVLAQDSSRVHINNSIIDGSGGYLGGMNKTFTIVHRSMASCQVISRHNAVLVGASSSFTGPEIDADDESIMYLAATKRTVEPQAHNTAVVLEADILQVDGFAGTSIPVLGTARLIAGPLNPITFTGYRLEFNDDFEQPDWQTIVWKQPESVLEDTLALWNTAGLTPGNYALRLTLFHSYGDSISMESPARLNLNTSVESDGQYQSKTIQLHPNYPNPFNPTTTIRISLPHKERIRLRIFNIQGSEIATLADGIYDTGHHSFKFDAGNAPAGIYLVRLETSTFSKTNRMILIK